MHHGAGRSLAQRVTDEGMAVAALALQRDEQVSWLDGAGVDGHAAGDKWCVDRAAGGFEQVVLGPQRAHRWPTRRRTTSTSSNGITVSPIVWPCSCPLPATARTSP